MTDVEDASQEGSEAQLVAIATPIGCFHRVHLALVKCEHRVLHCLMTTQGELEFGLFCAVVVIIVFVHSFIGELMGPAAIFLRNLAGLALEAGKDIEEL